MKSKFQISVLIIGILVAIFCVFTTNSKRIFTSQKGYLSYDIKPEDNFIFKNLPYRYSNKQR